MATVVDRPTLQNFIAGRFRPGGGDESVPDINPSDPSDVIARVPVGTAEDVQAAVKAARAALPAWRHLAGPERAEHLGRWAEAIDSRREELAQALAREVGKPIGEARGEVGRCVVILRYYAGDAVRSVGQVIPSKDEGALQFTLREPLGAVGLITPWNFPVAIPLWKAAPALAFGNTVVLKPSELSSQVAVLLAEMAQAAGLPEGVFNIVLGTGQAVGEPLLHASEIRAISFTGSVPVGARVASVCAERNIRFQTEMGGKNVVIVAPDADLDRAAGLAAAGAMRFAGQKCTATSRAIVAKEVEEAFLDKLREQVEALPVGRPEDPATAVGPLITEAARDRTIGALEDAGDRCLLGGGTPEGSPFDRGFFVEPTVLRRVDPDSSFSQDELFAPVLATLVADDMDEAIALANRTRYGLSASLFTRDIGRAVDYMRRIEVGLVRVNGDTTGVDPHAPFGGLKASSSGSREQGPAAREFYTETKTVQVNP